MGYRLENERPVNNCGQEMPFDLPYFHWLLEILFRALFTNPSCTTPVADHSNLIVVPGTKNGTSKAYHRASLLDGHFKIVAHSDR